MVAMEKVGEVIQVSEVTTMECTHGPGEQLQRLSLVTWEGEVSQVFAVIILSCLEGVSSIAAEPISTLLTV